MVYNFFLKLSILFVVISLLFGPLIRIVIGNDELIINTKSELTSIIIKSQDKLPILFHYLMIISGLTYILLAIYIIHNMKK